MRSSDWREKRNNQVASTRGPMDVKVKHRWRTGTLISSRYSQQWTWPVAKSAVDLLRLLQQQSTLSPGGEGVSSHRSLSLAYGVRILRKFVEITVRGRNDREQSYVINSICIRRCYLKNSADQLEQIEFFQKICGREKELNQVINGIHWRRTSHATRLTRISAIWNWAAHLAPNRKGEGSTWDSSPIWLVTGVCLFYSAPRRNCVSSEKCE